MVSTPPAAGVISARSGFLPHRHGFPFPNAFTPGTPVLSVPTPWGTIPVGDLSKGICGGMVFAALDCFRHGVPVPTDPSDPTLIRRLVRRLWNSFNGPVGVSRIYSWTCRPDRSGWRASVQKLTAEREWPELVRRMRADGEPVPLMLIRTRTRNPFDMGHNHQVLATGFDYAPDAGRAVVHLYDPNHPAGSESEPPVTLTFDVTNPEGRWAEHSREGANVRGFFLNWYRAKRPPDPRSR